MLEHDTRTLIRLVYILSASYLIHTYNDLFPAFGDSARMLNKLSSLSLVSPLIPFTAAFIAGSFSAPVSNEFLSSRATPPRRSNSFLTVVHVDMPILWFFSRHRRCFRRSIFHCIAASKYSRRASRSHESIMLIRR